MQHLKSKLPILTSNSNRIIIPSSIRQVRFQSTTGGPTEMSVKDKIEALTAKQLKLSERAGRTKRDSGMIGTIPVFANHIRPRATRTVPAGTSLRKRGSYIWADLGNEIYTKSILWKWRAILGKEWQEKFSKTAITAYRAVNSASATGNYSALSPISNIALIDTIKAQRAKLSGLKMSWKLHGEVSQDIICARQQEVMIQDEFVGQVAVRFITDQSLEIQDSDGKFVGTGRHTLPQRVTEFYIFQRELWRPNEEWKIIKKVQENDPVADPTATL